MTPFLQSVVQDLWTKLGDDFSRTVIVFPNKRAGLFMNEHLLQCAGNRPVWAPQYITINQLFQQFVPELSVNDPIDTALRIVQLYRELTGKSDVSVDWFYGWAERILSDFDDVDKNLADPERLFKNVRELKEIDDPADYLTEEQIADLQRFFGVFDAGGKSQVRERYQELWNTLLPMYKQLNQQLLEEHTAYEGALYRRVIDKVKSGDVVLDEAVDHYVFVGFNVLDKVEQELFAYLKREGRAWFYWDYDEYYMRQSPGGTPGEAKHEAGFFMMQNLLSFPNELDASLFHNMEQPKALQMVSATTEAIQAQYVAPWLKQHLTSDAKRTAIVLCNENLVQPVLHALPDDITELNVTKGFPLAHTEVMTMVESKFGEWEREQKDARNTLTLRQMLETLSQMVHDRAVEYATEVAAMEAVGEDTEHADEALKTIYATVQEKFERVLQGEAYYTMYTIINRFARIIDRYADMGQMTLVTLRRLVRAVVRQSSIPFHGEPAVGLQIMGVLETRCLDFDHVIMLSVNDGVLPKKANDASFIPYLLRKAFDLTTPERKTAVFAYYFYRLMQRASHVTMTYSTATDGMTTGEMSRFMTQLLVEWEGPIDHFTLNCSQQSVVGRPHDIAKPADLVQRLMRYQHLANRKYPSLSPSALGVYMDCQVRFYFQHVMKIRERDDKSTELKPNTFGSIFHKAAELVYEELRLAGGKVTPGLLERIYKDEKRIAKYVRDAFDCYNEEVEKRGNGCKIEYRPLEARVLEMYLVTLLKRDSEMGDFIIVSNEKEAMFLVAAQQNGQPVSVCINGTVDRIDCIRDADGVTRLRILDYKTGGGNLEGNVVDKAVAKSIDDLFTDKNYMLQTFLYDQMFEFLARRDKTVAPYAQLPVMPSLFFVTKASKSGYDSRLKIGDDFVTDLAQYADAFRPRLAAFITEILDLSRPFQPVASLNPTAAGRMCASCPYRTICFNPQGAE